MAKIGKGKSHRIGLKQKHKVEKKVKEHHRKIRREARKNPNRRKALRKDPGIPNMYPFKEQLMAKMIRQEERLKEESRKRGREIAKRRGLLEEDPDPPMSIEELVARAGREQEQWGERQLAKRVEFGSLTDTSKKAYFKEFRKVVESADVILEVLDARDPLGCRCKAIERMILSRYPNKRIVMILNKIDLVPKENAAAWLKYLRNSFPTFLFKATTSSSRTFGRSKTAPSNASSGLLKSSECLGADTLIQLLKNYSRKAGMKQAITAGVIGYPNVGKSSLINSLKRSKAVGVGGTPGFTKRMQEIQLDKKVKLLDCPGIVFDDAADDVDITLRNCMKIEKIDAPELVVEAIVARCNARDLVLQYQIPEFRDHMEFLALVARKRGRLAKGGIPDYIAAARMILQDWNQGHISFFTSPPKDMDDVHINASVVSEWADDFDVGSVMETEVVTLESLKSLESDREHFMEMAPTEAPDTVLDAFIEGIENLNLNDDDEDDTDEDGEASSTSQSHTQQNLYEPEDELNPQINKAKKKMQKKLRKRRQDEEEEDEEEDSAYDFATDFVADNDGEDDGEDEDEEAFEDGDEDDYELDDDVEME